MTGTSASTASGAPASGNRLRYEVFASPTRPIRGGGTFSPTTSTLICGEIEAVLVDAQALKADVRALGDMIAATGRRLTTIFITHGHADHYFGAARIAERFPGLQVVAMEGVANYVQQNNEQGIKQWANWFGDDAVSPDLLPTALETDTIKLDGRDLPVMEIGQGDIAPSTILRIPELNALVVGDIAYNKIHLMLALGGPDRWADWIASVEKLETLHPSIVVVGHKKPDAPDDDVDTILGETKAYIRNFGEAVKASETSDAVVEIMKGKYPDYGNEFTLIFSARAAMRAKAG